MAKDKDKARERAEAKAKELEAVTPFEFNPPPEDFLSSGCTLLNVAVSKHADRCVPKGTYLYIVGTSGSGKTWWCFTFLAEAARNKHFKDYRFVYDNVENGALMDVGKHFGSKVLERLEPPAAGDTPCSTTAKEFYLNVEANTRKGPCIYILDSMDGLTDDTQDEVFEAELKNHLGGSEKVPGSMGMGKAKTNSQHIGRLARNLRTSGSILVIISQTRQNLKSSWGGSTRAGGDALMFYAHVNVWLKTTGKITNRHLGKDREIGDTVQLDVRKNRITGWEGKLEVPFLKDHGPDDVGSCIDYLLEEEVFKKIKLSRGAGIRAAEFDFEGSREGLVKAIQDQGREAELSRMCAELWVSIEEGAKLERKSKYT